MADIVAVTCPECDKKFKPKSDVRGKKIKCPFCKEPFTVPAEKKGKPNAAKPAKKKAEEPISLVDEVKPPDPPPEPAKPERDTQFDNDPDPYGVKSQDLTPRCPDCAQELENAQSIICLYCGYNSLTRERGQTKKIKAVTAQKQLAYLGPAIGSAAFVFFGIVFLIYFTVVSPYHVDGVPILNLTDHESIRMWFTVISLGILWGAGVYCFKKFIEQPNPDEELLD